MEIKQLSVFLENKQGRLYSVLNVLAENKLNIRALSLADTSDFAILRLVINDPDKGLEILKENNFIVKMSTSIAVELNDTPGGLSSVLKILKENNIDLEYLYAFTHDPSETAMLLIHTEDLEKTQKVFIDNGVKLVKAETVYNL